MRAGIIASGHVEAGGGALLLRDTFTAADGVLMKDRQPDYGMYSSVPSDVVIGEGRLYVGWNGVATMGGSRLLVDAGVPDVTITFAYQGFECRDGTYHHGAFVILRGTGNDLIGCSLRPEGNRIDLVRYSSGSWTTLQQATRVLNVVTPLALVVQGDAITVMSDGELLLSHSMSSDELAMPSGVYGLLQPANGVSAGKPRAKWALDNLEITT